MHCWCCCSWSSVDRIRHGNVINWEGFRPFFCARLLGDVNAVKKGKAGMRVGRSAAGKAVRRERCKSHLRNRVDVDF